MCTVCGTELPEQRGPRARRYCSRACQAKAYRARQEQRQGHRAAGADEQRLLDEYADVPARQLADSLSLAAGRVAGTLTAGQPADDHDLGILARIPVVLAARAHQAMAAAHALHGIPDRQAAPTVAVLDLATPPLPVPKAQPSRDDSAPTPTATPPAVRRPRPDRRASRDDSVPAPAPAPTRTGIEPRPQRLSKKRADTVVDAAELVRDPEHRDTHRWILRSGETVLGYVEPSYGGVSRSGRNGWISRLAGLTGPRGATRDEAAVDLAMRWVRLVTAAPKRTITGSH